MGTKPSLLPPKVYVVIRPWFYCVSMAFRLHCRGLRTSRAACAAIRGPEPASLFVGNRFTCDRRQSPDLLFSFLIVVVAGDCVTAIQLFSFARDTEFAVKLDSGHTRMKGIMFV